MKQLVLSNFNEFERKSYNNNLNSLVLTKLIFKPTWIIPLKLLITTNLLTCYNLKRQFLLIFRIYVVKIIKNILQKKLFSMPTCKQHYMNLPNYIKPQHLWLSLQYIQERTFLTNENKNAYEWLFCCMISQSHQGLAKL